VLELVASSALQHPGAAPVPAGQVRHLLNKGPHPAIGYVAEVPAHPQVNQYLPTAHRQIVKLTQVAAVHPCRGAAAARALRMVAARRDLQLDPIEIMHYPVDAHRRKMREQITDCCEAT
jgi:hypothetical protein